MAGISAAEAGARTLVLEKTRRPGTKILMSGGTRCNITHATDDRGIVEAYGPPGRSLHSALAAFGVEDCLAFFDAEGVATKVEETGKVFPVSDRAADVLAVLVARLERSGAVLSLEEPLLSMEPHEGGWLLRTGKGERRARRVILTVGGKSYPGSGTTGDGYSICERLGHTIIPPRPALVPITTGAQWVAELRGLTIPDTFVRVVEDGSCLASRRGSLLFAHFGLSGPVILDVSRAVSGHPSPGKLHLEIDWLPNEKEAALDERLRIETSSAGKKGLAAVLSSMLPRRLGEALLARCGWPADRKGAGLSKPERAELAAAIKRLRVPVAGTLGFGRAEVTAGGVALDEVDSRTMESKKARGLHLAGELLDLDGPIGGYNFQAAWSTGWLAGLKAATAALAES
ncbi:MAG: NAD(P)/FAD-dependent oxidoreductase [Gemmataceae bacterium]|nr:NAD(P)/FAD-dependent oxidoreductase [Gemmataceae bacterium]